MPKIQLKFSCTTLTSAKTMKSTNTIKLAIETNFNNKWFDQFSLSDRKSYLCSLVAVQTTLRFSSKSVFEHVEQSYRLIRDEKLRSIRNSKVVE